MMFTGAPDAKERACRHYASCRLYVHASILYTRGRIIDIGWRMDIKRRPRADSRIYIIRTSARVLLTGHFSCGRGAGTTPVNLRVLSVVFHSLFFLFLWGIIYITLSLAASPFLCALAGEDDGTCRGTEMPAIDIAAGARAGGGAGGSSTCASSRAIFRETENISRRFSWKPRRQGGGVYANYYKEVW